jgi:hypothetical protein
MEPHPRRIERRMDTRSLVQVRDFQMHSTWCEVRSKGRERALGAAPGETVDQVQDAQRTTSSYLGKLKSRVWKTDDYPARTRGG